MSLERLKLESQILCPCRLCQNLAFGRLIVHERGVARVKWSILEFYMPLNFSGVDEHRIVKFSARFGLWSINLVTTKLLSPKWAWSRSRDVFTFWQISVNISKTVQNRDILNERLIGNRIWIIKWQQRQWPWRSFTGCRLFQMESVEHLCSILHEFYWQCARGPSTLAELPVWIGRLQTREHFIVETQ